MNLLKTSLFCSMLIMSVSCAHHSQKSCSKKSCDEKSKCDYKQKCSDGSCKKSWQI